MHKVNLSVLATIAFASAVCGLAQSEQDKAGARHVIGLENVGRNSAGRLAIVDGGLQFQDGKTKASLPVASIDDIAIGTETTQAGGKAGTAAKTAAMAAPYDSGAALSILLRTNVDVLTVSSRDSGGGLHYTILALPKGQAEPQRAQLITAGAHVLPPSGQELKEEKPAAAEAPAAPVTINSRLSASAIQIEPVGAGDVWIPAEFRAAIYEFLVTRVR
jgi:hypothetical protein